MMNRGAKMKPGRAESGRNNEMKAGLATGKCTNVKVVVRVRPLNLTECLGNHKNVVRVMDERVVVFDPKESVDTFIPKKRARIKGNVLDRRVKDLRFIFDRVFDEKSTNQEIFDHTTKPVIDSVLNGYNCTVFAYGATGAGKTHTMLGNGETPGVMFLTMMELYSRINEINEQPKACEVAVSYLEVYNETIRDLLMPGQALAVREDPHRGVCVKGLTLHQPRTAEELYGLLEYGNRNRSQHPTDANATSSRSHAVFQVFVRQKNQASGTGLKTDIQVGKMSLIDLAGSERATVTTNRGARFREGANINKSLLALGNCINALAENQGKNLHVPYRDSKLTRILKDSLGGNCRTVMIAAVSPSNLSYEDTYNTLKYADRAKSIKSNLVKNVVSVDVHISQYAKLVKELQQEVTCLKDKLNRFDSGEATPMRNLLPRNKEEIEKLKSEMKTVYDKRCEIKRDLTDTECLEKALMEKLQRKQKNVEWMNALSQDESKTGKVETRVRKCLSATKSRVKHIKERRDRLDDQLRQNNEWLRRTQDEVKMFQRNNSQDELNTPFFNIFENSCVNEVKLKEAEQQCKYYKKCLQNYESQRKRQTRLIDALLKFARKQFGVLKSSGMATNECNQDYDNIISIVEDNREVAWADQTLQPVKETDVNDVIKMVDANLSAVATNNFTPSRTPRSTLPNFSTDYTPKVLKTPTLVLNAKLYKDFLSPFTPQTTNTIGAVGGSRVAEHLEERPVRQNLLSVLNETGVSTATTTTTAPETKPTTTTTAKLTTISAGTTARRGASETTATTTKATSLTSVNLFLNKCDMPSNSPSRCLPASTKGLPSSKLVNKLTRANAANFNSQTDQNSTMSMITTSKMPNPRTVLNKSFPLHENSAIVNIQPFSKNHPGLNALRQKANATLGNDNTKKVPSYALLTKSAAQKITSRDMLAKRVTSGHSKENTAQPQPKRRKLHTEHTAKNHEKLKSHVTGLKRAVTVLNTKR